MINTRVGPFKKHLKFDYRDSWGYVEFSKDSESGLGIVLAQKTKKLGASKASASTLQRLKNWWPQKILKWKFYYIFCGCWIQIWKNFFDTSHRKKVLLLREVICWRLAFKRPPLLIKLFSYERYQKNSFRFGFSTHKIYNKIFISKFFEAINFSASVVWRPKLWRLRGFLFFELEQFWDQILNPWEILHNPSYPYNQISEFFLKGPTR